MSEFIEDPLTAEEYRGTLTAMYRDTAEFAIRTNTAPPEVMKMYGEFLDAAWDVMSRDRATMQTLGRLADNLDT